MNKFWEKIVGLSKKAYRRMKRKRIFIAVLSGILSIAVDLGFLGEAVAQNWEGQIDTVAFFLVGVGILSNPDKKKKAKKKVGTK